MPASLRVIYEIRVKKKGMEKMQMTKLIFLKEKNNSVLRYLVIFIVIFLLTNPGQSKTIFYGDDMIIASQTPAPVPIPGAIILLGSGIFSLIIGKNLRKKQHI